MTQEIARHERYKKYAEYAYRLKSAKFPIGTKVIGVYQNKNTGFYGYALKENNRVVIVYKGTDNIKTAQYSKDTSRDYKNDVNMTFRKRIPEQVTDAIVVYDQVKENFPNTPIDVVGHSLGGSLAQYVAILRNVNEAVCYSPVGIGKSVDDYLSQYGSKTPVDKITNYNNPNDKLTNYFRGDLYENNYVIGTIEAKGGTHNLENMAPLSTRQKGIPSYQPSGTKKKSKKQKACVGSYTVSGYTRADGTKVKGYTRHCGVKHSGLTEAERLAGQAKYKGV